MFAMPYRQFAQQVHGERVNDALGRRRADSERQLALTAWAAWLATWRHRVALWQSSRGGARMLAYGTGYHGDSVADD
jgi:hypothetical protein